ncbi:MAG: GerW family sporulation protein [Christensenellaceae bacterium]|nr:GerW family sporulation protein [Christensenellaceae bacterium]
MHPIESILSTTMCELKQMVDVNTIVGDPFVTPGGSTVIPISKVSFGFVSGGGEYGQSVHGKGGAESVKDNGFPFAGGTASGISITPVAFMTADADCVKLISTCQRSALDKVLECIPQMMGEVKEMLGRNKAAGEEEGRPAGDRPEEETHA